MKIDESQWCSVYKAEGGVMRRYIENIIGFALVGISMLVQMRYIQKTQYLIYAFFMFFVVVMILHTIEAVAIKKYDRKTYGNIYISCFA
nr:hypothetical protein [uncultured Mogibacterium sp.]